MPTHPHRPGEPDSNRPPDARPRSRAAPPVPRRARRVGAKYQTVACGRAPRRRASSSAVRAPPVPRRRGGLSCDACSVPEAQQLNIRRNTILLAAGLAVQLVDVPARRGRERADARRVTGIEGILGLGPAIFLASCGPRRASRRAGDGPLRPHAGDPAGFVIAAFGCSLIALATRSTRPSLVIAGFALRGAAGGDRAPRAHRRRRDVPARAARAGDLATSSSAPSSARSSARCLRAALRGQGARQRTRSRPVARSRRDRGRRARDRRSSSGPTRSGSRELRLARDEQPAPAAPLREIVRRPGVARPCSRRSRASR